MDAWVPLLKQVTIYFLSVLLVKDCDMNISQEVFTDGFILYDGIEGVEDGVRDQRKNRWG